MAWTLPTEVELLRDLVAIPSVSGDRGGDRAVRRETRARRAGLDGRARRRRRSASTVAGAAPGPDARAGLPPRRRAAGRGLDPRSVHAGRSKAPGSTVAARGDAKASVAAMLVAAADVADAARPAPRPAAVILLGYGEETRNTTMARAVAARRGDRRGGRGRADQSRGRRRAARPDDGGPRGARATSATPGTPATAASPMPITALARDLVRLDGLLNERVHPVLGTTTVTPTMLEAGVSRNVTPPVARRSSTSAARRPGPTTRSARCSSRALDCEVVVTSERLVPCETPAGSRLLAGRAAGAARGSRPSAARPAPTGSSFARPTRSSAVPAPAGARTPPTSTWTSPR